uniref:Serine/arginine repetitive matrix protein 2 n=1 Tax=Macrostomum lignano TaxID=282301 RepID=A0A1I8FZA2_9PLAT
RPLSQQRKLKQTEDQRSSAHGEDAAANREKKTRAQSARFSSRNKSGRSRGSSSSSSSSSTRKSDRRSKNRSHSRSGRTRRSAERSNREQTVEGREAKAYAHQLKQARAELLTARSRALKTLTVKHRRESRGLPQCLRYPKLLTADTYSASYIYSDTRIIDANLKKDRGDRYQPVFRGTSGALVDPHHPRPSQSRQSRGHRGANSPLGDRREASASSRGRQQQREAAASRQGDREYTRQSGKKPTEYSREPVFFNQLPEIRSRIKASRSARASRRRDVDYASAADECRRCLDSRQDSRRQKSAADGRQSRRSMAMSCSAYLSATPGSRAAVHDCIRRDDDRQAAGRPASDADEHENQSDNEAAQDNKSDRSSVSSARSSNTGRSSPSSSNQSDRRIENESD